MLYKKEYEYYYKKYYISLNDKKSLSFRNKTNYKNNNLFDKKDKIFITTENYYSYRTNNNLNSLNDKKSIKNFISESDKDGYSLSEKYKFIMMLSLNDNKDEIEFKCKELLSKIDLDKYKNYIIISDILSIISKYNLTKLLPDLKKLKKKLTINNFLKNDFNCTINYLEKIKNGKINIITKINICIKSNNNDDDGNNINNRYQTSINQSNKSQTNKILLKRPGTINEIKGGKLKNEDFNCIKSIREKLLNNTSHKKIIFLTIIIKNCILLDSKNWKKKI